jgi:hypothetical protein
MRRHLTGIGLAIVMILAMFFAGTWGYIRLLRLPAAANAPLSALPAGGGSLLANTSVLSALAALGGTAILAGILLVVPRVSALATGLPGLFALAWQALYLLNVRRALEIIPLRGHAFGAGWEALLFNGILGAFGLAMIIPLFVPSRWRGSSHRDTDDEASGFMADLKGSDASSRTEAFQPLASRPDAGRPREGATLAGMMPRGGPASDGPVPDGMMRAGGAPTSANPLPASVSSPRIPRTGLVAGGPPPGGPAPNGGLISGGPPPNGGPISNGGPPPNSGLISGGGPPPSTGPRPRSRPYRRPDGL